MKLPEILNKIKDMTACDTCVKCQKFSADDNMAYCPEKKQILYKKGNKFRAVFAANCSDWATNEYSIQNFETIYGSEHDFKTDIVL